jgi:hypothetical protein
MGRLGGEQMSRLTVGLFALALTGGGAAFFSGLLDPYFAENQPATLPTSVAMPFAKPKPTSTPSTTSATTVASAVPSTSSVEIIATESNTPPVPVQTATVLPEIQQPFVSTLDERIPVTTPETTLPKAAVTKPARKLDLDLRSCLDLPTEMEIAQCAYKLP